VGEHGQAAWNRAVRVRTREWRAALREDPRLRPLGIPYRARLAGGRGAVRAELYVVR
jgi:hypothetical protein